MKDINCDLKENDPLIQIGTYLDDRDNYIEDFGTDTISCFGLLKIEYQQFERNNLLDRCKNCIFIDFSGLIKADKKQLQKLESFLIRNSDSADIINEREHELSSGINISEDFQDVYNGDLAYNFYEATTFDGKIFPTIPIMLYYLNELKCFNNIDSYKAVCFYRMNKFHIYFNEYINIESNFEKQLSDERLSDIVIIVYQEMSIEIEVISNILAQILCNENKYMYPGEGIIDSPDY